MYTFRFNPVFKQWVLLGEAVPHALPLGKLQLQNPPKGVEVFAAAHFPASPFLLDPIEQPAHHKAVKGEMMFDEQPPVGEYEVLLYRGSTKFFSWSSEEWQQWLVLFMDRLHQLHLNYHVSHAICTLHTRALHTFEGREHAQRVGDLIAASHPISGLSLPIERDLIDRLVKNEKLYVLAKESAGILYAPSAPNQRREVWFLPTVNEDIESLSAKTRKDIAHALRSLFHVLHEEFPQSQWVMHMHLPPLGQKGDDSWWIQVYEDVAAPNTPLQVAPLPERFAKVLRHVLAAKKLG